MPEEMVAMLKKPPPYLGDDREPQKHLGQSYLYAGLIPFDKGRMTEVGSEQLFLALLSCNVACRQANH